MAAWRPPLPKKKGCRSLYWRASTAGLDWDRCSFSWAVNFQGHLCEVSTNKASGCRLKGVSELTNHTASTWRSPSDKSDTEIGRLFNKQKHSSGGNEDETQPSRRGGILSDSAGHGHRARLSLEIRHSDRAFSPAGGASDTTARMTTQKMQESFGQSFIIENKPGANGSIGATATRSGSSRMATH